MRLRTVVGSLLIALLGLLLYLDTLLFGGWRPVISLLLVGLALLGWGEFARITGIRGTGPKAHRGLDLLGAAGILYFFGMAYWYGVAASKGVSPPPGTPEVWQVRGILAVAGLAFAFVVFLRDHTSRYSSVLETLAGVVLLGAFFSYTLRIYHLPGWGGWEGPLLGAVYALGVKGNDTAAYYTGKALGRHHVFKVSPGKTLEGSVGALVFSALYFWAAGELLALYRPGDGAVGSLFPWPSGILLGMMISVASQIGDLAESLVKRVYQVKDSGALLPEFGGVLDMVDSLVFTGFLFWEMG